MRRTGLNSTLLSGSLLVVCCGGETVDASKGTTDAGADSEPSSDATLPEASTDGSPRCHTQEFADSVRAVTSGDLRALPLPQDAVGDVDAARAATRRFVAANRGIAPETLTMTVVECGTPSMALCSSIFNHDTLNTAFSMELLPLAQTLENCAALGEMTTWVLPGSSSRTVSLAGIDDGHLIGIVAFLP